MSPKSKTRKPKKKDQRTTGSASQAQCRHDIHACAFCDRPATQNVSAVTTFGQREGVACETHVKNLLTIAEREGATSIRMYPISFTSDIVKEFA